MRKLQRFTALASCLGLAVACSSSPEPPTQNPGLMGPDAKAGYDKDAEEQRLRDMMAVRVVDTSTGEAEEWEGSNVLTAVVQTCDNEVPACDGIGSPGTDQCAALECGATLLLCVTERMMSAARGGTEPTFQANGKTYKIPPQSAATNAELTETSVALTNLLSLGLSLAIPSADCPASGPTPNLQQARQLGPGTYGEFVASTLAESYFLGKEAWELYGQASLAVADAQLGTSPLRTVALTRNYSGAELSRSAAAHGFVGGSPGFQGEARPICTANSLSPEGRAALSILRESGLPPDYILGFEPYASRLGLSTIDTASLLNSHSLPLGSAKQRLEYFHQAQLDGNVQAHYDISIDGFAEARAWMAEEIVALARSRTATLPTDAGPGLAPTVPATFAKYAGTAGKAPSRPAAYYGALARTDGLDNQGRPDLTKGLWRIPFQLDSDFAWIDPVKITNDQSITDALNFATFVRINRGIVDKITKDTSLQNAANYPQVLGALASITNAHDSSGIITWCEASGTRTLTVGGFTPADHLVVVRGEDALACATEGAIEGAPCSADSYARLDLNQVGSAPLGYVNAVTKPASTFFDEPARYYLLQPREAGDTVAVGNADALVGFIPYQLGTGANACVEVPIVPQAEEAAKAALEPSPESCARSRTDCAGGAFDERIPLEDELSSDGDGIESSWKHYIAVARASAAESDRLGDEYVNTVVGSLQRDEEEDLRRNAREDRVAAELDTLQNICGTAIDPSALFKAMGMDSSGQLDSGAGGTGTPCPNPVPEGSYCLNGRLVTNWESHLQGDDPQIKKLATCLNDFGNVTYAHMGDEKLCAWETEAVSGDPSTIQLCGAVPEGRSCPSVGSKCEPPAEALDKDNDGTPDKLLLEDYLGFFNTSSTLPTLDSTSACAAIRRIREGTSENVTDDLMKIRNSAVFDPITAKTNLSRIGLELELGGYIRVSVGGQTYATGTTQGGPSDEWPCAAINPPDCEGGNGESLFCSAATCDNALSLGAQSTRLYKAVVAAMALAEPSTSFDLEVPAYTFYTSLPTNPTAPSPRYALAPNGDYIGYEEWGNERWRVFNMPTPIPGFVLSYAGDGFVFPYYSLQEEYNSSFQLWPYRVGRIYEDTQTFDPYWYENFSFARVPLRALPRSLGAPTRLAGLTNPTETQKGPALAALLGEQISGIWVDSYSDATPGGPISKGTSNFSEMAISGGNNHQFAAARTYLDAGEDSSSVLDGLELLCAAGVGGLDSKSCSGGVAPTLHNLNDLDKLGAHIQCMGDAITRAAVTTVLHDLPRSALTPLVEQQGGVAGGGEYAESVSLLRSALLDIATSGPSMGREMRNFGQDLKQLRHTMATFDLKDQMAEVQLASQTVAAIAACQTQQAMWGPGNQSISLTAGVNNAVTCINAYAQIGFAEKLKDLGDQSNQQERQVAIADFNKRFTDHVTALELEDTKLKSAFETAARQVVTIKNLKQRGRRSLSRAVWYASAQSEATIPLSTTFDRRRDTARVRYEAAHKNAKRLAFLARRAIEQRIGTPLDALSNDLPLVDAPATWANSICTTSGIDYANLTGADGNTKANFADAYVGEYVTKLENVVESYRLESNFHEGTDTTLLSLRDDIFKTKTSCEVDSVNLLRQPLDFDHPRSAFDPSNPGWYVEGCAWSDLLDSEGAVVGRASPNCVDVLDGPDLDGDGLPDSPFSASLGQTRPALGSTIRFGGPSHCSDADVNCGYLTSARLVQQVELEPGQYRFSFYAKLTGGLTPTDLEDVLLVTGGSNVTTHSLATNDPDWVRVYAFFTVNNPTTVEVGFGSSAGGNRIADEVVVAAPQLDRAQTFVSESQMSSEIAEPAPFEVPNDAGKITRLTCADSFGSTFRQVAWDRGCVKLCPNGYQSSCLETATDHCYWDATFQLSQRAWENGEVFGQGGFARGNFNYRIEDIGVNFVGQNLRDCSNSDSPDACYSNAYLPFSLYHVGPFYVRNYEGNDFEALLFDGKIEHARGLAAGRYLGNPLSSGDQQLLTPYIRQEFRGRPLDGMFRIRIWDEEGVDFNKLEDVQLMINYRYWTRNN